jgi:hypothetical protein
MGRTCIPARLLRVYEKDANEEKPFTERSRGAQHKSCHIDEMKEGLLNYGFMRARGYHAHTNADNTDEKKERNKIDGKKEKNKR